MNIRTGMKIAAASTATAAMALGAAPLAMAETEAGFGEAQDLVAPTGDTASVTVTDIALSSDQIPTEVEGQLYEATATIEAKEGTVTPVLSNFNARTADGQSYQAVYEVPASEGNPEPLTEGASTTGKVYFDVKGEAPDSVVYSDVGSDEVIWTDDPGQ
ncbi:MPT63 family protein [Mycolicibacterium smegmatis]|uniref:FHA domain containing protein n=3 Tax=Mycolicibacterium smegmatis TaxID=1772 RepID=I7G8C2_MYCS2|nr:MPT63 family protein [Mycolicibacterium smegmatis]ABK69541.1 immunogenic protein MPT63 [Mycolicibacterium smegmatis MC2 155]AFP41907.1 FHA domain containing protein [Mycolicibacterium smegmatis MC2 155]AIU10634.1 immunogenic protein MPT63 [Mycolicibacterium smegmatis MC2 155]AIU17259.1 immunogenic protein MPT63 [Mycolicibacterium smegmatis]AIU23882.1 immunogenic protein MPT63 [Mycolicibacterium smegmatis]